MAARKAATGAGQGIPDVESCTQRLRAHIYEFAKALVDAVNEAAAKRHDDGFRRAMREAADIPGASSSPR